MNPPEVIDILLPTDGELVFDGLTQVMVMVSEPLTEDAATLVKELVIGVDEVVLFWIDDIGEWGETVYDTETSSLLSLVEVPWWTLGFKLGNHRVWARANYERLTLKEGAEGGEEGEAMDVVEITLVTLPVVGSRPDRVEGIEGEEVGDQKDEAGGEGQEKRGVGSVPRRTGRAKARVSQPPSGQVVGGESLHRKGEAPSKAQRSTAKRPKAKRPNAKRPKGSRRGSSVMRWQAAPSDTPSVKVHWIVDKLTGQEACVGDGGTVAGFEAKVKLYVLINPNGNSIMGVSAQGSYLENTLHKEDRQSGDLQFSGASQPDPCSPTPAPGQMLFALEAPWVTTNLHNSTGDPIDSTQTVTYTISTKYTYTWMNMQTGQTGQEQGSAAITVKVDNLLISVSPPSPLFWDPDNPAGSQTTISGSMTDSQKANVRVTYKIYQLDRADDTDNFVIAIKIQEPVLCPGGFTWTWDGVVTDAMGNPIMDPMTGQPMKAEKGIYAYDVVVEDFPTPGMDRDQKKSQFLSIGQVSVEYVGFNNLSNKTTLKVGYVLYDQRNLVLSMFASWAKVEVYDDRLTLVGSAPGGIDTNLPGTTNPRWNFVNVDCDLSEGCKVYVVVSAQDYHPDREKGHRLKLALEKGKVITHTIQLTWLETDSPITANPGNGAPGTAIGVRMFPDKLSLDDTIDRQRAKVKATISPADPFVTVYFKRFDPDDPSANSGPIDANDLNGVPTGGDNRGSGALVGTNGPDSQGITWSRTDANGVATADFFCSLNPGDNFKVAASLCYSYIAGLRVDGLDIRDAAGKVLPTAKGAVTDLLTVWRKLHVEVDSMFAEVVTGNSTGLTANSLQDTTKTWDDDQFNSYDEPWRLNPNTAQSRTFRIVDTTTVRVFTDPSDGDMTTVASTGNPYSIAYVGFPADTTNAVGDLLRGDVADPDATGIVSAFNECYIDVVFLSAPYNQPKIPWHHHFGGTIETFTANIPPFFSRYRQSPENNKWLSVYVAGVYDNPLSNSDNDHIDWGDRELGVPGTTYDLEPEYTMIPMETIRDLAAQPRWDETQRDYVLTWTEQERQHVVRAAVLHELGHHFGLDHNRDFQPDNRHRTGQAPSNIMWAPITIQEDLVNGRPRDMEEEYYPLTPLRFRHQEVAQIRAFSFQGSP